MGFNANMKPARTEAAKAQFTNNEIKTAAELQSEREDAQFLRDWKEPGDIRNGITAREQQKAFDDAKAKADQAIRSHAAAAAARKPSLKTCQELAEIVKASPDMDAKTMQRLMLGMLGRIHKSERAFDDLLQLNVQQAETILKLSSKLKRTDGDFSRFDSSSS